MSAVDDSALPNSSVFPKEVAFGVVPIFVPEVDQKPTGAVRPQYLLIQHVLGHWGFPKGRPEAGEKGSETAAREFAEETGWPAPRPSLETSKPAT